MPGSRELTGIGSKRKSGLSPGGTLLTGLFSSVGSEHLPYKQGVRGSNPRRDTK